MSVPGDHYTLIDPEAPSFPTIQKLITEAGAWIGSAVDPPHEVSPIHRTGPVRLGG